MDVYKADERKEQILHPGDRFVPPGREVYASLAG